MNPFSASPARRRSAALAFTLSLGTALILWNNGRQSGRIEALTPSSVPTSMSKDFQESEGASDYAQKLGALKRRIPQVRTLEEKQHLAEEFAVLGTSAHYRNKGEGLLSLEAFDQALALVIPLSSPMSESGIRMNRATTLGMLGKSDEERRELEKALALANPLPEGELRVAEILYRLGDRLGTSGLYGEARTALDRSLRIRQKKAEVNGQADCLAVLGQLAYEEGQGALARQLLEQASKLYVVKGNTPARGAVLGQLGDIALSEGELSEAEQLYGEGLAIWTEAKQEFWIGRFLARQAKLAVKQGKLEEAERLAHESLTLIQASNGPTAVVWPLMVLGEVAAKRQDTKLAQQYFHEALIEHQYAGRAFGILQVEQALKGLPRG